MKNSLSIMICVGRLYELKSRLFQFSTGEEIREEYVHVYIHMG